MSNVVRGRRRLPSSGIPRRVSSRSNSFAMLSVANVFSPPRSTMLIAGASCVFTLDAFPAHTLLLHLPPTAPQSASTEQFVVHLPAAHEPATAPGHSSSIEHPFAAGPV